MTKNIVRKSLSIFSASVLGATLLVAAPAAYAAGELKLEPSSGTLYAVPHNTDFELKVTPNAGFSAAELQFLKFKVETAGGVNIRAVTSTTSTSAEVGSSILVDDASTSAVTAALDSSATGVGFIALYATDAAGNDFAVTASNVTATVTAFVDKDQDGVVDAGEWQASQTVTFVDSDLLDMTLTMVQPVLGATGPVARLTSTQINLDQSHARFVVDFSGPSSYSQDNQTGSYSALLARSTYTGNDTIEAGTYSANLELGGSTDILTISRTVSATTVNNLVVTAAAGGDSAALASGASAANIRAGSGSLTYKVVVRNSSNVPLANRTVNLNVSETAINNIEAAATISVGGKTLKNADVTDTEDIDVTGVSDVNGEVTFVISYTGLGAVTAGDPFQVEATVDGVSGAVDTFTTVAVAATTLYSANYQVNDEEPVVAIDAPFTLTYHLVDQFGKLFAANGYSVTATAPNSVAATGVFSGGIASVNFAGYNNLNKGTKQITSAVTNTVGATTSGIASATFTVFVGAPTAPVTIDLAGTYGTAASKTTLNVEATADADIRGGTATDAPTAEITDVTATVRDSNGNGTRSQVTFSGANLIFKSAAGIYKKGSITVSTDSSGVADVDVSSQVAGAQVMTVTAGSASKTQSIVFADAAATAGTKWTFSVPTTVAAGSSFKVTGTLTDAYGNPVRVTDTADVAVVYDGPGLVSGSLPTTTNAKGEFSFFVLVGSNDKGTATITAYYDQSSDGDFTGVTKTDRDVVSSVTVTLGAAAAAAATTGKVNVGSFNGKLVVYALGLDGARISWKVAGRWGVANAVGNTLNRFDRPVGASGRDVIVEIYVDRELRMTKTVRTR